MTWTTIPDSNIEPGKAVRSVDMIAMRDNIPALAAGDAGAPRIQTAAINDTAVTAPKLATTTNERDWVLGRTAGAAVGAVGTYALLQNQQPTIAVNVGATVSGTFLRYSNALGNVITGGVTGTWRCMGYASEFGYEASGSAVTLFLRIA